MPTPPARGNIDYDQLQECVRLGAGGRFQMAASTPVSGGNLPVYDNDSNVKDGLRPLTTVPYLGKVRKPVGDYVARAEDTGTLISFRPDTAETFQTLVLPNPPHSDMWVCEVGNLGPGTVLVQPEDGCTLDRGTSARPLVVGQSLGIYSDGQNYFSLRGAAVVSGGSGGSGGGGTGGTGYADRATFLSGFGGPILPNSDTGARYIATRALTPVEVWAYLAEPPVNGDFTLDLMRSQDEGQNWASILTAPLVIPGGVHHGSTRAFARDANLAPGNLLRLIVYACGEGGGQAAYARGLVCSLRLDAADIPGAERANFLLGLNGNLPLYQNLRAYFLATRRTRPSVLYCRVVAPPPADCYLDLQVSQGDEWASIFLAPLRIAAGYAGTTTTTDFAEVTIEAGSLLRPMFVGGTGNCGAGYTLSLELQIITD
jgi:hypothetical protein